MRLKKTFACPYNAFVGEIGIHLATLDDLEDVWALERESPSAAHWSRAQYEAIFQLDSPPRLCLTAEQDGHLLGFLLAQTAGPEWELENVVVAASARRRGLGTMLLRALLQRAQQQQAMAILLEVRPSNAAARALYRACGFIEVGTRLRYYQQPPEDAIICRCELPARA